MKNLKSIKTKNKYNDIISLLGEQGQRIVWSMLPFKIVIFDINDLVTPTVITKLVDTTKEGDIFIEETSDGTFIMKRVNDLPFLNGTDYSYVELVNLSTYYVESSGLPYPAFCFDKSEFREGQLLFYSMGHTFAPARGLANHFKIALLIFDVINENANLEVENV